jgi:hypothetical protein
LIHFSMAEDLHTWPRIKLRCSRRRSAPSFDASVSSCVVATIAAPARDTSVHGDLKQHRILVRAEPRAPRLSVFCPGLVGRTGAATQINELNQPKVSKRPKRSVYRDRRQCVATREVRS